MMIVHIPRPGWSAVSGGWRKIKETNSDTPKRRNTSSSSNIRGEAMSLEQAKREFPEAFS